MPKGRKEEGKEEDKEMLSFSFEYDVRFCPKCRDMELHRDVDGKWKCEKCRKKINKNRRIKNETLKTNL